MARSEFEEQYDAAVAGEEGDRAVDAAILTQPVSHLEPAEPILVRRDVTVREAADRMKEKRQGAVCVVDDAGKLVGIFSERDVLTRVVASDLDVRRTPVGSVMTPSPEAIQPSTKIAFALNLLSVGGFRNLPIVDASGKPIGIVFTRHFVKYIVSLFPEATLNLPPQEALKDPNQIAGG